MTKHLSFLLFFFASYLAFSQCNPDPNQGAIIANPAGSYDMQLNNNVINSDELTFDPLMDTLTAFPHAMAGMDFTADVTIRVPVDTALYYDLDNNGEIDQATEYFEGVSIASMNIADIVGLPIGFSWECVGGVSDSPELGDCAWSGGDFGCISIKSDGPVNGLLAGNGVQAYPINVILDVSASYLVFGTIPYPVNTQVNDLLDYFVLVVDDGNNVSSSEIIDSRNFKLISAYPNPAKDHFRIQYGNDNMSDVSVNMYDILGNIVVSETHKSAIGYNEILFNSDNLKAGIYTFTLSNDTQSITERIVIK